MATRLFAALIGVFYAAIGILGFVPALVYPPPDRLRYEDMGLSFGHGFLFGWWPTNIAHNIVYLLIGVGGIAIAGALRLARRFSRLLFAAAVLFVFMGILPWHFNELWGLMPLFGWNVLVHVLTALLAWYFGFISPIAEAAPDRPLPT